MVLVVLVMVLVVLGVVLIIIEVVARKMRISQVLLFNVEFPYLPFLGDNMR